MTTLKMLPGKDRLEILWRVAVTSALEGQGEAYEIYAKLLYRHLTDTQPFCTLHDARSKAQEAK